MPLWVGCEILNFSCRMVKPTICICKNKDADQLRSNCEADQRLCFCYMDSAISILYIQSSKLLACFCDCTGWFISDLVGDPNCWFSHTKAHLISLKMIIDNEVKVKCDKGSVVHQEAFIVVIFNITINHLSCDQTNKVKCAPHSLN